MIGWLLFLSFVLGFALTWIYMVRSVSRTVEPIAAARGRVRQVEVDDSEIARPAPRRDEAIREPRTEPLRTTESSGSRAVLFDDE